MKDDYAIDSVAAPTGRSGRALFHILDKAKATKLKAAKGKIAAIKLLRTTAIRMVDLADGSSNPRLAVVHISRSSGRPNITTTTPKPTDA